MNFNAFFLQLKKIYKDQGFFALLLFLVSVLKNKLINKYINGSFSQKGEDLILERIFKGKKKGYYVDVGANDPDFYNNTKKFYLKGWKGINIEPNPILFNKFLIDRKRDISLNVGIGKRTGTAIFYEFEVNSLSTFSKKDKENKVKVGYKLKKEYKIKIYRLENIVRKYCKKKVDFITIDTEGLDYEVLQSNNWKTFRPKAVCVETGDVWSVLSGRLRNNKKKIIDKFMLNKGYKVFYSNDLNTIYVEN